MCYKISCMISHLLYFSEKFAVCAAGVSLVSCLVFTLTMMLMLGIGLGYNYCYVDYQSRARYKLVPAHYRTIRPEYQLLRSPIDEITEPTNSTFKESALFHKLTTSIRTDIDSTTVKGASLELSSPSTKIVYKKLLKGASNDIENLRNYKFWAIPPTISTKTTNKTESTLTSTEVTNTTGTTADGLTFTIKQLQYDPGKTTPMIHSEPDIAFTDNGNNMISINGLDLIALLSQLRAENRNYSLQILAT